MPACAARARGDFAAAPLLPAYCRRRGGTQGFLPRATELLKLGGTFFLGFAPFILAVSLGFGAVRCRRRRQGPA